MERNRLPQEAGQRLEVEMNDPASGLQVFPVDLEVAKALSQVSRDSIPDMPDRIVSATALFLDLPRVTQDNRIQSAGIQTVW